jgi:hypothetical protein
LKGFEMTEQQERMMIAAIFKAEEMVRDDWSPDVKQLHKLLVRIWGSVLTEGDEPIDDGFISGILDDGEDASGDLTDS